MFIATIPKTSERLEVILHDFKIQFKNRPTTLAKLLESSLLFKQIQLVLQDFPNWQYRTTSLSVESENTQRITVFSDRADDFTFFKFTCTDEDKLYTLTIYINFISEVETLMTRFSLDEFWIGEKNANSPQSTAP